MVPEYPYAAVFGADVLKSAVRYLPDEKIEEYGD